MPTRDSRKSTPKAPAGKKPAGAKAASGAAPKSRRVGKPTNPFLERHPPKKIQKP